MGWKMYSAGVISSPETVAACLKPNPNFGSEITFFRKTSQWGGKCIRQALFPPLNSRSLLETKPELRL